MKPSTYSRVIYTYKPSRWFNKLTVYLGAMVLISIVSWNVYELYGDKRKAIHIHERALIELQQRLDMALKQGINVKHISWRN